jgi:hypothetical protein
MNYSSKVDECNKQVPGFTLAYMWLAVRVGWAVIYAGELVNPSKALL